jgi:uncharacterized membrane protein SirB2
LTYLAVKHVHLSFVALSFLGFVARGVLMLTDSPLSRQRLVRIVPHLIDTVLLLSALYLAYVVMQVPGDHAWLISKVVGLILYIALGVVALKRGKTRTIRLVSWLLGLLVFAWIVSVAIQKTPLGFLAGPF